MPPLVFTASELAGKIIGARDLVSGMQPLSTLPDIEPAVFRAAHESIQTLSVGLNSIDAALKRLPADSALGLKRRAHLQTWLLGAVCEGRGRVLDIVKRHLPRDASGPRPVPPSLQQAYGSVDGFIDAIDQGGNLGRLGGYIDEISAFYGGPDWALTQGFDLVRGLPRQEDLPSLTWSVAAARMEFAVAKLLKNERSFELASGFLYGDFREGRELYEAADEMEVRGKIPHNLQRLMSDAQFSFWWYLTDQGCR